MVSLDGASRVVEISPVIDWNGVIFVLAFVGMIWMIIFMANAFHEDFDVREEQKRKDEDED
jgi:hypothetical protein